MSKVRPRSIAEVGSAARADPAAFHDLLKEFVLTFSGMTSAERTESLAEEPALMNDDGVFDAYLAAAAELLVLREGLPRPEWVSWPGRFLRHPWYAGGLERLKPVLLVESPAAFRIRNLFVSANALDRPSYRLAMNEVVG